MGTGKELKRRLVKNDSIMHIFKRGRASFSFWELLSSDLRRLPFSSSHIREASAIGPDATNGQATGQSCICASVLRRQLIGLELRGTIGG
jgi:hypothetical protein